MATLTAEGMGDAIRAFAAERVRNTMLLARENVTNATPVDTGHAASNWVLSLGQPFTGIAGSRESVSWTEQQTGDDAIRGYSADHVKNNVPIYLRNNVPYMKYLDAGWSQQAPSNFIRRALTGAGATRHMPPGTRRDARTMLRKLALHAIHRGE